MSHLPPIRLPASIGGQFSLNLQSTTQRKLPVQFQDLSQTDLAILPDHHFLSQSLDTLARSEEPIFVNGRLDTSTLGAADFDVDVASGFLPPDAPIRRLGSHWAVWEDLWEASSQIQLDDPSPAAQSWRRQVQHLPVIPTDDLRTLPYLRRAHVVLSFIAHRYVHSLPTDQAILPVGVSEPWRLVSERLDMPAVLTYADTVLWNWTYADPALGLRADNVRITNTFTNTPDEEHFYLVSLWIEMHGVLALRLMANSLDEAFINDSLAHQRIADYLFALSQSIDDLSATMKGVKDDCQPLVFYNLIRPWFNGGKWKHEQANSSGFLETNYGGPSAGQSSLIHALDVFLTIDHSARADEGLEALDHNETFMTRMSAYMPHHHRHFLRHLARQIPSIRDIALRTKKDSVLREAYNSAVDAMRRFRDTHSWVVTKYIVVPSQINVDVDEANLKGTGGTNLVAFLRRTRNRTIEAHIK